MMIRAFSAMENEKKPYPDRVRIRLILTMGLALTGLLTLILALVFADRIASDFQDGFYVGVGSGLTVAGIILSLMNLRLLRNAEAMKKTQIEETDERNRFIMQRTSGLAFYLLAFLVYVALMVAGFFDLTVFITLCGVFFLMALSFLVVKLLVARSC